MCGFTGVVSFGKINNDELKKSNQHSHCRGPDNLSNLVGGGDVNYNLWFNRLAILDLSEKANQPMISKDSNYILMFNGEIYNSLKLREKLSKLDYKFKTSHSDTETLFAGLQLFGVDFINKIEGQYAFIFFNKKERKIYLARDRVGQKPLYMHVNNQELLFGSNLKSILEIKKNNRVDVDSLQQYLAYGVNFSPRTLFKDIHKIPAGNYIEIDYSQDTFTSKNIQYWNISSYIDDKKFDQEEFEELFSESVSKRMLADVGIANFLSGGIDSTSIVKNLSDNGFQVNTFSVIIKNKKYNEKKYIQEVVDKYYTKHEEVTVDENIPKKIIRDAIRSLDEPYGDPSVVPSYYLSQLISSKYKVAISGDGGDELLGGYFRIKNHLMKKSKLNNLISKLYHISPSLMGSGTNFKSLDSNIFKSYLTYLEDLKFLNFFGISKFSEYLRINPFKKEVDYKVLLTAEYKYYLADQMMYKVDRTSMANSLEVRSPFVDHKLIEYIFSHSTEYFHTKIQKLPLRKYLSLDFSSEFLDRPKQGFVFDYKQWVYSNFDMIINELEKSELTTFLNTKKLHKLNIFKTRINALRLWRVYVLVNYLDEINS
ncbi:asparagine synthase (glutamine-hydrolyzing) [Candidatus Actinomarina]|nr:asparagine synthase (glutamine-hydrolyzing) [Candidatus Actinomarina sp.]|tara:strand:+ start:18825 stop:20612 length:1788 start_codon:yes stop_codon:yes gene_type:complete